MSGLLSITVYTSEAPAKRTMTKSRPCSQTLSDNMIYRKKSIGNIQKGVKVKRYGKIMHISKESDYLQQGYLKAY